MGLIVLDADVLIAMLNRDDPQHRKARRRILDALTEYSARAVSAMTLAEIMVGPIARGDAEAADARRFIEGLRAEVVPLDGDRARHLAAVRARTGLKMPDACVLATALELRGRQPDPVSIASFDRKLLAAWRSLSRASRLSA